MIVFSGSTDVALALSWALNLSLQGQACHWDRTITSNYEGQLGSSIHQGRPSAGVHGKLAEFCFLHAAALSSANSLGVRCGTWNGLPTLFNAFVLLSALLSVVIISHLHSLALKKTCLCIVILRFLGRVV